MKTSRRPGAKPQGPFEDKRRTLTTRITEGTRVKLEAAARDSTRSLSQEIELRLELSLDRDEGLGGRRTAALLRSLAAMVEPHYDDNYHWLDDRDAFNVVIDRWTQYLKTKAPTRAVADQAQIQSEFDELKKNISEA